MSRFFITCDSSCDLPIDFLERNNIKFIPISYTIGEDEQKDDLSFDQKNLFYNALKKGIVCKTSSYNINEILEVWNSTGEPILHFSLSSALSKCFEHCELAKNETEKKVLVIDSLIASLGIGMLIIKACELRDKEYSLEDAYKEINDLVLKINTVYTTNTLEGFYKSGRMKKSKFIVGKLLHINPILKVGNKGDLYVYKKCHGEKKSQDAIIEEIKNTVIDPENQTLYVCHADAYDRAKSLAEKIKEEIGFKDLYVTTMGPSVACHTGVGLLSYFYFGKEREESK